MIDKLAKTVLKQVKDEYPYVAHPAAMRAEITKAEKLPEEYSYETVSYTHLTLPTNREV